MPKDPKRRFAVTKQKKHFRDRVSELFSRLNIRKTKLAYKAKRLRRSILNSTLSYKQIERERNIATS